MTVEQLIEQTNLIPVTLPFPRREIKGVYVGDLLSWVMSRARKNQVWITIMSNINVIAVASLTDVSCIILADGVIPDSEIKATALEKGINILSSDLPIFETAAVLNDLLK